MSAALRFAAFPLLTLGASALLWAHSSNPPVGHTGAPGEPTCAVAGCHDQYALNSGPGAVELPTELAWYSSVGTCPPETLTIPIRLSQPGATRWGFQLTVVDAAGASMGTLYRTDSTRTEVVEGARNYIFHTSAGTDAGLADSSGAWEAGWAPDWASFTYPLRAYVAGVAADNDGSPAGDYVYTDSAIIQIVIVDWWCGVIGDLNLDWSVNSADIIAMVNYIFRGVRPSNGGGILCDMNCSGNVTAADVIYLVNHVLKGGRYPCDPCLFCCEKRDLGWTCP